MSVLSSVDQLVCFRHSASVSPSNQPSRSATSIFIRRQFLLLLDSVSWKIDKNGGAGGQLIRGRRGEGTERMGRTEGRMEEGEIHVGRGLIAGWVIRGAGGFLMELAKTSATLKMRVLGLLLTTLLGEDKKFRPVDRSVR